MDLARVPLLLEQVLLVNVSPVRTVPPGCPTAANLGFAMVAGFPLMKCSWRFQTETRMIPFPNNHRATSIIILQRTIPLSQRARRSLGEDLEEEGSHQNNNFQRFPGDKQVVPVIRFKLGEKLQVKESRFQKGVLEIEAPPEEESLEK